MRPSSAWDTEVGVLEMAGESVPVHRHAPTRLPPGDVVACAVERHPGRYEALLVLPPGATASVAGCDPAVALARVRHGETASITATRGTGGETLTLVFRATTHRARASTTGARQCAGCRKVLEPGEVVVVCAECGAVHCAELCGRARGCDACAAPFQAGERP
jgi:hypothetical protein